jgi:hypothetical protein
VRERLWLGAKKRRQDAGATDGACVVLEVGAGRGEPRLCKDIRRIDLAEMGRSVLRPYIHLSTCDVGQRTVLAVRQVGLGELLGGEPEIGDVG